MSAKQKENRTEAILENGLTHLHIFYRKTKCGVHERCWVKEFMGSNRNQTTFIQSNCYTYHIPMKTPKKIGNDLKRLLEATL